MTQDCSAAVWRKNSRRTRNAIGALVRRLNKGVIQVKNYTGVNSSGDGRDEEKWTHLTLSER